MNERMRIDPTQARADGNADALALIDELCNLGERAPAGLIVESLSDAIGLAVELRTEEASARLEAWAGIVATPLIEGIKAAEAQPEFIETAASADAQRVIDAAVYTCCRVSEGRIIARQIEAGTLYEADDLSDALREVERQAGKLARFRRGTIAGRECTVLGALRDAKTSSPVSSFSPGESSEIEQRQGLGVGTCTTAASGACRTGERTGSGPSFFLPGTCCRP